MALFVQCDLVVSASVERGLHCGAVAFRVLLSREKLFLRFREDCCSHACKRGGGIAGLPACSRKGVASLRALPRSDGVESFAGIFARSVVC